MKYTPKPWIIDNARLIAAAPKMLELLKEAHNSLRTFTQAENYCQYDDDVRDAIEQILDEIEGE